MRKSDTKNNATKPVNARRAKNLIDSIRTSFKFKRAVPLLFLAIFSFSTFAALLSAPLAQATISLDNNMEACIANKGTWESDNSSAWCSKAIADWNPALRAEAWAVTNAFVWCVANSAGHLIDVVAGANRIDEDSMRAGIWFKENTSLDLIRGQPHKVPASYLIDNIGERGEVLCNAVVKEATELAGYGTDYRAFYCAAVPVKADGTRCTGDSGDFSGNEKAGGKTADYANEFYALIKRKAFRATEPPLGFDAQYLLNLSAFKHSQGCHASPTSSPGNNQDKIYRDIKIVNEAGTGFDLKTFEGENRGDKRWLYTTASGLTAQKSFSTVEKSCQEIADAINEYADDFIAWAKDHPGEAKDVIARSDDKGPGVDTPNEPSCRIDGIGWILCPIVNFSADIVDKSYDVVSALLTTPALNTDTADSANGAYVAWSMMRNFANIIFVISFLIIIYAQLSGMGINNYSIKKLLPKIIVAAILVNVSYWICAIAVDISNIAGSSLKGLFDGVTAKMPLPESTVGATGGNIWGPLAATVLASATIGILGLTVLLPLLIGALAAIVTVLLVLVMRQALIIALIVIAPLAFVALLLPNTEGLFKKWRALFTTLLVMFPVIAIIFGASALASRVVQSTTYSGEGGDFYSGKMFLEIVGAGITIIPLFIAPIVMKTAGGVLNRFAGIVNNPNKGVFDRMRKGAAGLRTSRQALRDAKSYNRTGLARKLDVRGYGVRHRGRAEATLKARQREAQIGAATDVADMAQNGTGIIADNLRRNLAGGGGEAGKDRALNNATNTLDQLQIAEVKAASAVLSNLNLTRDQKQELEQGRSINVGGREYKGGNIQKASLENAVNEQRFGDIEEAMKSTENATNPGARSFLANSIKANYASTKAGAAHLVDPNMLQQFVSGKDAAGNKVSFTEADLVQSTKKSMESMSANLMSTQKGPTLDRIEAAKMSDPLSLAAINAKKTAKDLEANTELFDKMGQAEKATVLRIKV